MATQMTGECHFGLHQHCKGSSQYGGQYSDGSLLMAYLPCECECHGKRRVVKDTGRWRRDPVTGRRYQSGAKTSELVDADKG